MMSTFQCLSDHNRLFFLQGQNVENMFEIDEKSGEIKVKVPLDRDPPNGRPVWSFNVLATDNGGKNGLDGYAEVQVTIGSSAAI